MWCDDEKNFDLYYKIIVRKKKTEFSNIFKQTTNTGYEYLFLQLTEEQLLIENCIVKVYLGLQQKKKTRKESTQRKIFT